MNNCGKRFHTEAAKFRFLNELIKILTPKVFLSVSDGFYVLIIVSIQGSLPPFKLLESTHSYTVKEI